MALTKNITEIGTGYSGGWYKDYKVDFLSYGSIVDSYNRRSISYSGVYIPSLSDITIEADNVIQNTECVDFSNNLSTCKLNYSINNYRLSNITSVTTTTGEILGAYINSDSVATNALMSEQRHNYENGYIIEKFNSTVMKVLFIDGKLVCTQYTNLSYESTFTYHALFLSYFITNVVEPCCLDSIP